MLLITSRGDSRRALLKRKPFKQWHRAPGSGTGHRANGLAPLGPGFPNLDRSRPSVTDEWVRWTQRARATQRAWAASYTNTWGPCSFRLETSAHGRRCTGGSHSQTGGTADRGIQAPAAGSIGSVPVASVAVSVSAASTARARAPSIKFPGRRWAGRSCQQQNRSSRKETDRVENLHLLIP